MSLTMRTVERSKKLGRLDNDACWSAVERRDRAADGTFVYSVRTTGVYCRPSCAARLPRRENVAFHQTCTDAERAGFRPCKRCRPNASTLAEVHAGAVGAILVAATAKGVCAIEFGNDPEMLVRALQDRFPRAQLLGGDKAFERLVAKVVGFVEAPGRGLDLPLDIRGTAFQQQVWKAIRDIPAGSIASYRDLAEQLGAPISVRAA